MIPHHRFSWLICVVCLYLSFADCHVDSLDAAEPNETFATSTVLSAGTLVVTDSLSPGQLSRPDTLLGVKDLAGSITQFDDNSSTLGDGKASGVTGIPTNNGAISFAVSGVGDSAFVGSHGEAGDYDVEIEVFDSLGDVITSFFTGVSTLQPNVVDNFTFAGTAEWVGGTYSANIDNGLADPSGGDVDFFTFTGLAAGASFVAETFDPASAINTFMFLYDSSGNVVAADDNGGMDNFSLLSGTVPGDGQLTFAVTGFGDTFREGEHTEDGAYSLAVEIDTGIAADFNNSGVVDGLDLGIWTSSYGDNEGGDANDDQDSDGSDFLVWQRQFGSTITSLSASRIPEPSSLVLLLLAIVAARQRAIMLNVEF